MGDLTSAEQIFREVERSVPTGGKELSLVLLNRGLMLFSSGQYEDAEKHFQRALELEPHSLAACSNKSLAQMYARNLRGATETIEAVCDKTDTQSGSQTAIRSSVYVIFDSCFSNLTYSCDYLPSNMPS